MGLLELLAAWKVVLDAGAIVAVIVLALATYRHAERDAAIHEQVKIFFEKFEKHEEECARSWTTQEIKNEKSHNADDRIVEALSSLGTRIEGSGGETGRRLDALSNEVRGLSDRVIVLETTIRRERGVT